MAGKLARWLHRLKGGPPVVIVSGLPRSGTSLVMQMIAAGGLDEGTDRVRGEDEDNPKGYYELERVKDLDKGGDKGWLAEYRGRAVKVISFLLRELPPDLSYRVVFIERDLDEVLRSQKKMLERRGETGGEGGDEKLKEAFDGHLRKVRSLLEGSAWFDTLTVRYHDILENPAAEAARINAFLGGGLDETAMAAAVDPSLYRNRREER